MKDAGGTVEVMGMETHVNVRQNRRHYEVANFVSRGNLGAAAKTASRLKLCVMHHSLFPNERAADRTSLTPRLACRPDGQQRKRGKPDASPPPVWRWQPRASDGHGAAGRGRSKKRMPVCNGPDRGSRFAPRESAHLLQVRRRKAFANFNMARRFCPQGRPSPNGSPHWRRYGNTAKCSGTSRCVSRRTHGLAPH